MTKYHYLLYFQSFLVLLWSLFLSLILFSLIGPSMCYLLFAGASTLGLFHYYPPMIVLSKVDIHHALLLDSSINLNSLYSQYYVLKIYRSGDVEQNPGPSTNHDTSDTLSETYSNITTGGLGIMNLNIQSLKSKIDILSVEAQPYDILVFTETWLNGNTADDELLIPNFCPPYRMDRIISLKTLSGS